MSSSPFHHLLCVNTEVLITSWKANYWSTLYMASNKAHHMICHLDSHRRQTSIGSRVFKHSLVSSQNVSPCIVNFEEQCSLWLWLALRVSAPSPNLKHSWIYSSWSMQYELKFGLNYWVFQQQICGLFLHSAAKYYWHCSPKVVFHRR